MNAVWSKLRARCSLACALVAVACGYSEDEWQAQLAKYNQLNGTLEQEKTNHAATRAELEAAQNQVKSLSGELEKQGVDVENLNRSLVEVGTEKERLSADMSQLQQALEEYKKRAAQLERIRQRFEVLRDKLQSLTKMGLKVEVRHNRMVISLPGDVLFASGQDTLREEGKEVLAAVAEVIRNDAQLSQRYFQVAGHTDSVALKGGRFSDNWGLSAMRARRVVVFLVGPLDAREGGGGLDPTRLHAAGYGDTDPIAENTSAEGKQQNRRVELVLMPNVEEMLDLKSLI
jgi:chemotaxis protein MotB